MKRIFYPIGHGGFYHEEFKNFKIIYDCGSKKSSYRKEVIENNFIKDEIIDVLFISHFDSDHVNGIPKLNEHCKIKRVVMPLLHENTKIALSKLYKIYEPSLVPLIENPKKFFGEDTKLIYVTPNNEEIPRDPKIIVIEDISNDLEITNNTILKSNRISINNWIFIPHNDEHKDRKEELEKLFNEFNMDIEKFEKDSNYTLDMISTDSQKTLKFKEKFKNIYDKLTNKINENSMLLYSGVSKANGLKKKSYSKVEDELMIQNSLASLYTGDSNLNKINIKNIFNTYWTNIGTIQIPHHGSLKNFNCNILSDDKSYYCPISVPTDSKHHPNIKVLDLIKNMNSSPLKITDNKKSKFIEYIYDENEILEKLEKEIDKCGKEILLFFL